MSLSLALVGDIHGAWGEADVRYFDTSDYELVIFVGDLVRTFQSEGRVVARSIARMAKPALVMPGNHDGPNLPQLAAEVLPPLGFLRPVLGRGQERRCDALRSALGGVSLLGYSRHSLGVIQLIAARPHSCGGPRLAYPRHAREVYGVTSMQDSAMKIRALVDECDERPIVFVGHNGPSGLGDARNSICGRDFHPDAGDWGDPDLALAVRHAVDTGHTVAAVLFGHMHHGLRGGGRRPFSLQREGVVYVNAARVPRVFERDGQHLRHHVCVEIVDGVASAREVLVPG